MTTTSTAPQRIDADALTALLAVDGGPVLLDVRSPAEYESAHIPGAINIPVDVLAGQARDVHDRLNGPAVLICQGGPRAVQACQHLRAVGFDDAVVLDGGMNRWDDGTRPVRRGVQRWALERQVRLVAGSLVLTGIGLSLVTPRAKFLAGAIGGGLTFSALSNTCAMGNLLSRLPYNRADGYDTDAALDAVGRR
jgi:rhodanese-related sulfurtransferase